MLARVFLLLMMYLAGSLSANGEDLVGQILDRAERHLAAADLANAMNLLEQARSLAPRDPRVVALSGRWSRARAEKVAAHKRTADFLVMSKRYYDAARELVAATALDPDDREAVEKLEKTQQAIRSMEKHQESGISVDPATGRAADPDLYDALSLLRRAREAKDRGDLPLALDLATRVLAREKANAEAERLRTEILQIIREFDLLGDLEADTKSGRFFEALQRLDTLLRSNPENRDLRLRRAAVLLRLERYGDALRDYEKALELLATPTEVLPALVKIYTGLGRPQETLALLADPRLQGERAGWKMYIKTYISAFPAATAALFAAVIGFGVSVAVLFRTLDSLVERCPGGVLLKAVKALVFCAAGDPAGQSGPMRAIAEKIDHPWFYYCTGLVLIVRGEFDAAQKYLVPCLDAPDFAPKAYFFLGIVRTRLGQKMADHDFERAVIEGLKGWSGMWRPGFLVRLEESAARGETGDLLQKTSFGGFAAQVLGQRE